MKTEETVVRSLDDLIFENRNHAYGAYVVRKAYPSSVNRGTIFTLGLAAAVAALSFVNREPSVKSNPDTQDKAHVFREYSVPELKKELPVATAAQSQRRGDLTPVATTEPVEDVIVDESIVYQSGSETGEERAVFNDTPGDEIIAAVEPVAPVVEDKVWIHTEVAAQYKGGMEAMAKFISRNMKYPSVARRMNIQGTVYVSFIVGKTGEIMDATVIKGIDAACDAEAIRVINLMRDWSPGLQGGSPVKVRMVLPITFRLQ